MRPGNIRTPLFRKIDDKNCHLRENNDKYLLFESIVNNIALYYLFVNGLVYKYQKIHDNIRQYMAN